MIFPNFSWVTQVRPKFKILEQTERVKSIRMQSLTYQKASGIFLSFSCLVTVFSCLVGGNKEFLPI